MRTLVRALVATLAVGAGAFAATESGASPQVSITAGTNPVTEGASAAFTLTRTGSSADALIVNLNVAETGAMLAGTPSGVVTFAIGSTTAGLVLATGDDEVAEAASVVTAVLAAGNGYTVDASAASATVTVEDDDAAPVVTSNLPEEVPENRVAIGTLTATDADTDVADLVWSVVGGLDAERVTLSVDGFLAFRTPKDFEMPEDDDDGGDYEIVVQVTDGANPVDVEFKIEVTDVNDVAPVVATASPVLVPEHRVAIATLTATDADTPAADLVWSVVDGVDADKITLSAGGVLAFKTAKDFEAPDDADRDGDYEVTVRVTDGVATAEASLTIRLTDERERAPVVTTASPILVSENRAAIATLTARDADTPAVDLVWSIEGGADAAAFTLSADGVLVFGSAKDFETPDDADRDGDYEVTVRVTDGTTPVEASLTVRLTDVNDVAPEVATASPILVPENRRTIATLTATDADTPAADLVWWIVGSVDANKITLSAGGVLAFKTAKDFEAPDDADRDGDYEVTVRVTDGVATAEASLTVRLTDDRERAPVVTTASPILVPENRAAIATLTARDEDTPAADLVWSIEGGADAAAFTLSADGVLAFGSAKDFEAPDDANHDGDYEVTVRVTDGVATAEASLTVRLTDERERAPVVTTASPILVSENRVAIATLTARDADTPDADLVWSIEGGADAAAFTLSADGVLVFGSAKDFEAPDDADRDGDYEVTVRVTDGATPVEASLTVRLTDVDDVAPEVATSSPVLVPENRRTIAMLTATDADTPDADLVWSVVGGVDADKITLSVRDILVFYTAKDFEAPDDADRDGDYEVTVRVTDGATATEAALTVRLADVDEAPIGTGFNLTYENVAVEYGAYLVARLRWTAPETDPDVTAWRLEWQKVGPSQDSLPGQYHQSRSYTLPVASGTSVSSGDPYSADLLLTSSSYEFTSNVVGSAANDSHVFRVVAVRGSTDHATSEEVRGQFDPEFHMRSYVRSAVTRFEAASPWVGEVFDFLELNGIPLIYKYPFDAGGVLAFCIGPSDCTEIKVTGVIYPRVEPDDYLLLHELGHVYDSGVLSLSNRVPMLIANLYLFDVWLAAWSAGLYCAGASELMADLLSHVTDGTGKFWLRYWGGCKSPKKNTQEAVQVVRSALAGQMPAWFQNSFGSNSEAGLDGFWELLDRVRGGDLRHVTAGWMVNVLRNEFGGLCRPGFVREYDQLLQRYVGPDTWPISNPWRDGGCVPGAPVEVEASRDGGVLAVRWNAPDSVGSSPVTGYQVQWKAADQDYSDMAADGRSTSLQGELRDLEIPYDGAAPVAGVRVRALNDEGESEWEEVAVTRETGPAVSSATVDGTLLRLDFGVVLDETSTPVTGAFAVTVGSAARVVDSVEVSGSAVVLTLSTAVAVGETVTVGYTVPTGANASPIRDLLGRSAVGFSNWPVTNSTPNTPPSGRPTISGSPRVGTTLTASSARISDADGLTGATFAWQWIATGGHGDADIAGATGPSYTLTVAENGKTVKVRVTFTDGGGTQETLVSKATAVVEVSLTANFSNVPGSHDGSTRFTSELHFSEEIRYLRIESLLVSGGVVRGLWQPDVYDFANWRFIIEPATRGDISLALEVVSCRVVEAVCTPDRRELAEGVSVTIPGPASGPKVSIAAGTSPVTEGTPAVFTLSRTDSLASELVVDVSVTEIGAMLAGTPAAAVTFAVDAQTVELTVATEDDEVGESASEVTAALVAGSGYTVDANAASATVTAEDDDGGPANTAPTGLPTIAGTSQVGETLTASAAGIADADGLAGAVFAWQWIANDGTSDADITGATSATYVLTTAEAGKTIKVRVTFTDDGGTEETLVSDPTAAVVAALAASFVSVPAEHDGVTEFWLELTFDAPVVQGSRKHIRALLGASGGAVTGLQRKDDRLDRWRVRVEPDSHGAVTVSLAASPACGQTGAVCTADGRALAQGISGTVPGPASGISRVSIAAVTSPVSEGTSATFTLTRTGFLADVLTVGVGVTETGAMLGGVPATGVTFGAGSATAAALAVVTEDDEAVEAASVVTAALVAGSGYALDANAATAAVTVEDDDEAPVVTAAAQVDALENGVAVATLTATDADTPPADLVWSIEGGVDAAAFTLGADGVLVFGSAKDFEAPDDADNDGDYEVTVRVTDGANPVDAALVVRLVDVDEIAPMLSDASVDGAALALVFSETLDASGRPAPSAFAVTVDSAARGVSGVSVSASTVTLTLVSAVVAGETVTVGYTVPVGANASPLRDDAGNPVAGFTDGAVRNDTAAPLNTAPTGLPTIAGTAQVGETLTVSATGIADADGLAGAVFAWQWIANDGTADADIAGATSATYTLTTAEAGQTVKVRVTFTDDGGTEETLVSDPTAAVVAAALTASFGSIPGSHDGSTAFTFELRFSEEVPINYRTLRDESLEVSGGTVTRARRLTQGSNLGWTITVEPATDGDITIALPVRTCGATGAVCTADGRALAQGISGTVPGPASGIPRVSIAAVTSPVSEGTSATFTLTRTGSSADALTVGVSVTETGAMLVGVPATGVTFGAGSATAALAAVTEDDEAVETASVVTAALVAGSGYALEANAATAAVTVEDDDEAPVVTAAARVDALENGVAVATLTATDADTPPADLVWSIEGGVDAAAFTLSAGGVLAFGSAKDFEAPDDADNDGDYEVTVRVTDGANPVDAALVVRLVDVDEIAPTLSDASVDGAALALAFSEALDASGRPAPGAFTVTVDGAARGVSGVAVSASTVTLTLVSAVVAGETVTVGYTVPAGANASRLRDDAGNPVASFSGGAVRNDTAAPLNTAPTGLPTIAGTAQVGETLTASAAGIADADGLAGAVFAWQWIANDGAADADLAGATSATYTLTTAEAGQTIKVRVTFTDDGGTEETLVSDPTAAVVAAALTASFGSIPGSHDGSTAFTFELRFSEEVPISYRTLRDESLEASGGTVTRARRLTQGSDLGWTITIEPATDGDITIALPVRTCGATGAVCTADGRALAQGISGTVPGPASGIPRVSIAAVTSPVSEGTSATFTLTRTGSSADVLTVGVSVTETGAMLVGVPATGVTFGAGSATAALAAVTEDDEAVETASVVTAALVAGSGYALEANAATAAVTVEDDDEAPVVTAAARVDALENGVAVATLTATDADTPPADLVWSIEGGVDAAAFTLGADGVLAFGSAKDFEAPDDADNDGDYEVTVRVTDGANPVDAALVVRLVDVDEIAPTLSGASVDGAALALVFSETLDASGRPAPGAFTVTVDGAARGVSGVAVSASTVTLTLVSAVVAGETVTVGYTVPAGANASPLRDDAGNPVAGFTGEAVRNDTAAPLNTAPTGFPTIAGTAQVGETLTASAAGIADADGLAGAVFAWQWIANDGTADADIAGATSATYTLTTAEAGKTVKVRVTFTDDGGTEETLVSDPTAAVVAAALTASFGSIPGSHDGSTAFTFELRFSEEVPISYRTLRDESLEVSGGTVTRARRLTQGSDLGWTITVEPATDGDITIALPVRTCGATGAVCTADGRALAQGISGTVPGPASGISRVSIAAVTSPVSEGTSATFTLTRTGSSADALTVGVSVTETGAMLAGVPATGVTFGAGSATAALAVVTEDDEAVETASVVTAALVAGSGYALEANAATAAVTVEDDDEAPVVTAAAQVDALENGVAVATLTATDADTPPADLVWSIEGGVDAAAFTLSAGGVLAFGSAKDFEAPDDADNDGDYEVTVRVTDGANPVDAALVVRLVDVDEIAPTLSDASVDGAALALVFSEVLDASGRPAPSAFAVTVDGAARGVSGVAVSASTVTLTLVSAVVAGETVTVGYTVPAGANASPLRDDAGNPVAGFTGEAVRNDTAAPLNTAPTGLPMIAGTAQVGETLTASATGIADADGLAGAVFAWQWIANDGTADADIAGATSATYTLTTAEAGQTIKVRVTFTDDGGTEETLVSAAKAVAVVALPVVSIAAASSPVTEGSAAEFTLRRTGPASLPLTVSVSVRQAGAVLSGTLDSTVMFASGSAESRLRVATVDDGVNEADGRVTASVVAGSGYDVHANASSAGVDVYDDDAKAVSTGVETLWTSTLTVESIGGALLGTVGGGNALSPDGWSEDGEAFEAEQLYYFPQYSELAFTLSAAPLETGQLMLHLDDLQMPLRGSPGVRYFYWVVDHPGWQVGQAVAVKLTRSGRDTAVAAGVSVEDAQVQEAEGAVLSFRVTLDAAQSSTVSVRYATSGGTATAGADFVGQSGALRFAPGQTGKTVSVAVLNDAHDEGSETMTLTLSRPFGAELADATATGTIVNTDPLPGAWLARFGRTVAEHVIGAVDDRLTAPHDTGSQVTIAGHRVDLDGGGQSWDGAWEPGRGDGAPLRPGRDRAGPSDPLLDDRFFSDGLVSGASRELSARELLSGTAFRFASPGGDGAGQWTMWGRGAWSGFDARDEALSLDGDVTTGMVGTDYRRDGWLAGLVFSHSEGSGTYALDGVTQERTRGELDTSLTGLYPYLGIELSERLTAWGVAGYGQGTLTLRDEDAAALETDIDFTMAAGGMRGEVLGGGERGGFGLAVESDALIARTGSEGIAGLLGTAATVSRLRLGLEGSYELALDGGGTLAPTLEMGLRHDGGDAETGFGVELGGGLRYADPVRGISTDFNVRGLVAHEDSGYGEWGASGSLRYDPTGASDLGPSLTLTQHWGVSSSGGMESLFARHTMSGIAPEDDRYAPGARLDADVGYGFSVPGGRSVAIPYAGVSRSAQGQALRLGGRLRSGTATQWHLGGEFPEGEHTFRIGYRYRLGSLLGLGVEGIRRDGAAGESPEHGIRLRGILRW